MPSCTSSNVKWAAWPPARQWVHCCHHCPQNNFKFVVPTFSGGKKIKSRLTSNHPTLPHLTVVRSSKTMCLGMYVNIFYLPFNKQSYYKQLACILFHVVYMHEHKWHIITRWAWGNCSTKVCWKAAWEATFRSFTESHMQSAIIVPITAWNVTSIAPIYHYILMAQ
jgi:hypothetical protein